MMWNSPILTKAGKWSRLVLIVAVVAIGWAGTRRAAAAEPDLFTQFQDPPREYSLVPYWAWVEEIEPERASTPK